MKNMKPYEVFTVVRVIVAVIVVLTMMINF